ncbi:MAG: glucose-1-phosphate adenylyltransferase [Microthrixaceae bacterium]
MAPPKVLVMILAGGEGRRLLPLTNDRAKPAVPFGGSYRLIDFVLSNFANAQYTRIVLLTQYKSHSLDLHISRTWRFSTLLGSYVSSVPAQMRLGPYWFAGSADAIHQNLNLVHDEKPDIVCVFGADHIYRMDPAQMVEAHRRHGGVTVAAIPVRREEATAFGVIEADADGLITRFHEKPADPVAMPGRPDLALASMGNYVFDADVLVDAVTPGAIIHQPHDVGGDVMPALAAKGMARVYDFSTNEVPGQEANERGYWRDVGTIDAYYDANMDLVSAVPVFSLYNRHWPVLTHSPPRPPAKLSRGSSGLLPEVSDTMVCGAAIVSARTRRARSSGRTASWTRPRCAARSCSTECRWATAPSCTAVWSTRRCGSRPEPV